MGSWRRRVLKEAPDALGCPTWWWLWMGRGRRSGSTSPMERQVNGFVEPVLLFERR